MSIQASLPGSVVISGAEGPRCDRVNGIYEPTDELCNDLPVYKKKTDSGIWMECIIHSGEYKWYIKPTANRGPTDKTSYASCPVDGGKSGLPQNCKSGKWDVGTGKGFVNQPSTLCALSDPSVPVPSTLLQALSRVDARLMQEV